MNKYTAPVLKEVSFNARENITNEGALEGSNIYNDNTFKKWD